MKKYRAVLSVPTNKPWQATIEERILEASNFNYFLMKVMTVEEIKKGVRVLKVYEYLKDEYNTQRQVI